MTALWTVHGDGGRVGNGSVAADERLSWPLTIGFGAQHLLVAVPMTMLVPRLTGLPVSTTLLMSGIGTLLFLLVTRNRVPAFLGASLSFVVPLGVASEGGTGPAALLGGVVVVGLIVTAVGVAVKALGVRLLESAMPPVVTGALILVVAAGLASAPASGIERDPLPALVSAGACLTLMLVRGLGSRLSVLLALLAGWVFAGVTEAIDPERVAALHAADWVGLPELVAPRIHLSVVPVMVPLVIVVMAQQVGMVKAVDAVTGRDLDGSAGDALIGGGLATTLSGSVGGSGVVTYVQNVGVSATSRMYSTAACLLAATGAIALAFSPKFAALLGTIPAGVAGVVTLVLLGTVAMIGVRTWTRAGVDLTDPVNLAVVGTALLATVGDLTVSFGAVEVGGPVWGSVVLVLGYPLLRWLADALAAPRL